MPSGYSLWAGTSSAVTVWNLAGQWQTVIQGIIIIGLVIIGITIVWKFVRQMTQRDSEQ
jgi:membrane protein implicated in regulation of membrane protease activity